MNKAQFIKLTRLRLRDLPANTEVPVITGTRIVGQTLTMSLGTWTGLGSLVLQQQWIRDGDGAETPGEDIAGATGPTYVLTEQDGNSNISGRVWAPDPRGAVTAYAAGSIVASVLLFTGTPTTPIDLSVAYSFLPTISGGTAPYTVTSVGTALPAGLSLNAATGALTGTPSASGTYAGIILRVTDAAAVVVNLSLPTLVVATAVIPPTPTLSITHEGVTATFSSMVPTGYSPTGMPWIDTSGGPVTLTGFDTPSAPVLSADWRELVYNPIIKASEWVLRSGQSYQAHGAEWCPFSIPYLGEGGQPTPLPAGASVDQGFSERFSKAGAPVGSPNNFNVSGNAALMAYNSVKNICPGNTGQSYVIPQGTTGTVVKMIDNLDGNGNGTTGMRNIGNNQWRRPAKFAVFTFVNGTPPAGALMPSTSLAANDPERSIFFTMPNANKASLGPGFELPATSWNALPFDPNNFLWQPFFGQFGEFLRFWVINPNVLDQNGLNPGYSSGYSRDYGLRQVIHMAQLLAQGPAADETEWAKVLQVGVQLWGLIKRGHIGVNGAGQGAGYGPSTHWLLHAFHSTRPDIVEPIIQFRSNFKTQQFYANAGLINIKAAFDGNHDANLGPFTPAHVGMAFFAHTLGTVRDTPVIPRSDDFLDGVRDTDYEIGSAGQANTPELIVTAMLYAGPSVRKGDQTLAKIDTWTRASRSERSASIDYVDTYRRFAGAGTNVTGALDILADSTSSVLSLAFRDLYDLRRSEWGLPQLEAVPDAATPQYNKINIDSGAGDGSKLLAAGTVAGSFRWDIRKVGHDRLVAGVSNVVDANVEYSIDEVQFIPVSVGSPLYLNGQQPGLTPGKVHYVRWRRSSLIAAVKTYGPWSVNFKRSEKNTDIKRMIVTPTGTAAGTPVFVVEPKLYYKPYPKWWGPYYEELVTTPFDRTIPQIFIGSGYPTGITGALQYQMQRKVGAGAWTDIPGATTQNYYWSFDDMSPDGSTLLRGRVRTTSGSVDAFTNEMTIATVTEAGLLELYMEVVPPTGMITALQTYINNLKAAASGNLYALTDVLKIALHASQPTQLNLKTPGGGAWDSVLEGVKNLEGTYDVRMSDSDFTPYLGFQGDGIGKWLAFNFPDTPTAASVSAGINWSLNACSLVVKINNSLNVGNGSVLGGFGSHSQLIPNASGNVRGRMHSASNFSGPSSGGSRSGWSATIREDASGFYNARETAVSALGAFAPVAGTGNMGALKSGTLTYASDRASVYHIGRFTRAQYLEFRTLTDAFQVALAAL